MALDLGRKKYKKEKVHWLWLLLKYDVDWEFKESFEILSLGEWKINEIKAIKKMR